MNLILLHPEDFISTSRAVLKDRRRDHIHSVLSAKVGDELCVGLLNAKIGTGKVVKTGREIVLDVALTRTSPQPLPLKLIVPMIRPPMFKRLLFHATTLGIKDIIILNFSRVEKSLWQSSALRPEVVLEQLVLGLEQAKDTVLPQITLRRQFKPFIEGELPALAEGTDKIVADPSGQAKFTGGGKPLTLVIGPEGGFIPYELEELASIGFKAVNLGARILRVDTALPYIIGKLF